VCDDVQTMVGHGGTVTALTRVGAYVFSCSTDCKVILWRAAGDREATLYPWFEQQVGAFTPPARPAYVTSDFRVLWCPSLHHSRHCSVFFSPSSRTYSLTCSNSKSVVPTVVRWSTLPTQSPKVSIHTDGRLTAHACTCSERNSYAGDRIFLVRPPSEVSWRRRAAAFAEGDGNVRRLGEQRALQHHGEGGRHGRRVCGG
jgi:hypothetical protein